MVNFIKNILPYGIVKYYQGRTKSLLFGNIEEPEIFNKDGQIMRVFYLEDNASQYSYSFTAGRNGKFIFWDRVNQKLPIHFYTHDKMFETKSTAVKKFGLLTEPEVMIPKVYQRLLNNPILVSEFDAIFTHSSKLLERYDNTRLYLGQGSWFGTSPGGGWMDNQAFKKKNKNISMVSSNKIYLESHRLRIQLAKQLKNRHDVDTFGSFDGGPPIKIAEALSDYRFSIVLENEISPYYFTEKLLNCFASMTMPIYSGATKIDKFFNGQGIIPIDKYAPINEINKILDTCTEKLYEDRIMAIIDNYERVQKLLCVDDYIYNEYKDLF